MFDIASLKYPATIIIFSVLCFCVPVSGITADVEFRWAIMAYNGEKMEGLDFSGDEPPIVHTGIPLQVYLEHLNNCHIYLYLLDSNNELTPLYPAEEGYYNYGFPRGPKYVPPGMQSFTFVPPAGTESLYIIATVDRQFHIEKLTEEFLKHSSSAGQRKLLLTELEGIIKDREKDSVSADDIERVDRKIKTKDGIIETFFNGVEVDISESYGRKLLIDHR